MQTLGMRTLIWRSYTMGYMNVSEKERCHPLNLTGGKNETMLDELVGLSGCVHSNTKV